MEYNAYAATYMCRNMHVARKCGHMCYATPEHLCLVTRDDMCHRRTLRTAPYARRTLASLVPKPNPKRLNPGG